MKDIFNSQTNYQIKARVQQLNANSQAQWGKMTVYQMLKHCSENEKLMLRERTYSRRLLGRIFGKLALHASIKDDKPLDKNQPTHPDLKFTGEGDVEMQKKEWLSLLDKYIADAVDYTGFIHPFFGKMNKGQIGKLVYKHIDHHLRQFGV